jgi:hypothetical protein
MTTAKRKLKVKTKLQRQKRMNRPERLDAQERGYERIMALVLAKQWLPRSK